MLSIKFYNEWGEQNMRNHNNIFFSIVIAIFFIGTTPGCLEKSHNQYSESANKKRMVIKAIDYEYNVDINKAEKLLEKQTKVHGIDVINWPEYSYKPDVKFRIAYWRDQIWLKYYVNEDNIRAMETKINGNVYKDSCVEFFISTTGDDIYYNFEFNCIGTPHVGYGKVGTKKSLVDPEILKQIRTKSSLGKKPFDEISGGHHWEMMIIIPQNCFAYDKNLVLKKLEATANFYKCGDLTSRLHYVTWSPVIIAEPDFHQPDYFGELIFN